MAFKGWELAPRNKALISGDWMKSRYSESWKSDSPQNTTCSYFTGTTRVDVSAELKTWALRIRKLTVLREQVVRSSDNELGHKSTKFL